MSRILVIVFLLLGSQAQAGERWFSQAVVDHGAELFQQHCAVCHGANAEGTTNWKQRDANGNYPPPPLDGSAHAWHHSIPQLLSYIKGGSIKIGGVMPAFGDKLSDQQVLTLIAFFQSKWSDELYQRWHENFMQ